MNRVEIHYCYPTSDMAAKLGDSARGGFYVTVGVLPISPLFQTLNGAEGFCRNNCLTGARHGVGRQPAAAAELGGEG
jgi:hypothetical protein